MKQLLFLLLFPCLALAQYTGNAGQKITLGEQTTADGLVFRGVANDTNVITPFSDTSAYIILDTVNNRFYNYNRTTNVWSLAGGGVSVSSFSAGTTGLTPNTATTGAVTLGGTLAVANGGTGITSLGTGVATFLGTPSSANLAAAVTNETGSGALVFGTSPTLVTPALGTPSSGVLTSATGLPLTTGVTGVLPVANGGTNTSTAFTAGSVVFAGASGTYAQDNANLFFDNTNKRLGIGTTSPTSLLDLASSAGSLNFSARLATNGATGPSFTFTKTRGTIASPTAVQLNDDMGDINFSGAALIRGYNSLAPGANFTNGGLKILINSQAGGGSAERLTIISSGFTGIGTTTPTQRLHVGGNARIEAVGAGAFGDDLNITSDGTLTTETSDEKYKYNILPINYGLNTILQLKPVNFQWIKGEENDLGFIAQDVADIIPEAVNTNWNSDLLMRYNSIIPILTKAIQEQNALIKALEQRILILENK